MWRGRHRVNTGLLLSHLHRARGVLWGVIILGLLSTALICALLLRALAGLPS